MGVSGEKSIASRRLSGECWLGSLDSGHAGRIALSSP